MQMFFGYHTGKCQVIGLSAFTSTSSELSKNAKKYVGLPSQQNIRPSDAQRHDHRGSNQKELNSRHNKISNCHMPNGTTTAARVAGFVGLVLDWRSAPKDLSKPRSLSFQTWARTFLNRCDGSWRTDRHVRF